MGIFPSDIETALAFPATMGLSSSSKTVYDDKARDLLAETISPSSEKTVLAECRTLFLIVCPRTPDFRNADTGIGGASGKLFPVKIVAREYTLDLARGRLCEGAFFSLANQFEGAWLGVIIMVGVSGTPSPGNIVLAL
jgi:hypothetical protein